MQFYTDDWEAYSKVIPKEKHIIGKKYTIGIEQNNSNIRHFLGRMTRRTKVVSKSAEMVMATLKICWYVNEYGGFDECKNNFISIYG
jgi:insertion element IS1 protein InsB